MEGIQTHETVANQSTGLNGGGGGYDFGHIVQQDFKASFLGYRTTLELLINKNGIKGC